MLLQKLHPQGNNINNGPQSPAPVLSASTLAFITSVAALHSFLTCQDAAGDAGNTLHLRNVVVAEILVTGGVEELRVTEKSPEFGGNCTIGWLDGFCTDIKALRYQRPITKHAYPTQSKELS